MNVIPTLSALTEGSAGKTHLNGLRRALEADAAGMATAFGRSCNVGTRLLCFMQALIGWVDGRSSRPYEMYACGMRSQPHHCQVCSACQY